MADVFTEPDAWTGGSIELLLWFDRASNLSPASVLDAAWAWPYLDGPVLRSLEDFSSQLRIDIHAIDLQEHSAVYGIGTLPNGAQTAFASRVVIEDDGFYLTAGSPLGSLVRAYPAVGAYPLEGSPTDPWAREVYGWLANHARYIYHHARYAGGLVGWITTLEFDEARSGEIPARRYHGYLALAENEVDYLAPNVQEPLMTVGGNAA